METSITYYTWRMLKARPLIYRDYNLSAFKYIPDRGALKKRSTMSDKKKVENMFEKI